VRANVAAIARHPVIRLSINAFRAHGAAWDS
jgi:hypothetical protein